MDRHAVALVLEEIATLLDTVGENRFKARAFRTAARAIDRAQDDVGTLVVAGALRDLPGIGPATARIIEELVLTGEARYHLELRERAPSGLRALLRVPGLGTKKIAMLHEQLGITDIDALENAARSGHIATVRGFGERTQQRILDGIAFARDVAGRRRYHQADEAAQRLAGFVRALPGVSGAVTAGALRRGLEVVDGIVIVAGVTGAPADVARALRATSGLSWSAADADDVVTGTFADGLAVEVRLALADAMGAVLLHATGPGAHIDALRRVAADRGIELTPSGLLRDGVAQPAAGEADIYELLDMQYVPPELRAGGAELELAVQRRLPRLVEFADLRGCFHCHTTWSDGTARVREMAEGALALGWEYLGIADHSRNAGYAGGLSPVQIRAQQREIAAWNRARGDELRLFSGVEADILADGQLDYAAQGDGGVLDALDHVIASVHSGFRMERDVMTRRITRALRDPRVTMLGHPTGRLLLTREGYDVDLEAVIQEAAAAGAAIEINADPHRLDMSWQHWPRACELGVRCAINPDAHSVAALRNVRYGVVMARRGGLTAADVINAWPCEAVEAELRRRR